MAGHKCPFCGQVMVVGAGTYSKIILSFSGQIYDRDRHLYMDLLFIEMFKCPNCNRISTYTAGGDGQFANLNMNIRPVVTYNQYPDYIPEAIRIDYQEACAIVNLSPKASATLSRRCLQGMIRNFWGIKKNRLVDEIDGLKGQVPADQWKVIDGIRKLGNIGAHMEKDVDVIVDIDPNEAQKLIKLIELLMKDWYINRYEQQKLYSEILDIVDDKNQQKQLTTPAP